MFNLPHTLRAIATVLLTTAITLASAQTEFPNKPITLLVGSAPGGSNDIFARVIGKQMQEVLGVSVVVENKPAAGGILANVLLAKAPADGYTLVVLSSTFTTGAAVRKNLQYDAIKSFTPIAMLAKGPMLITVGNNTSYKSLEDLVKFAKANPGKLNYGTSGVGSINQFASELLAEAADI
ncbi:MAG: putative extracytoplasmic binding receptor, partial [Pseudomonadota bacterium]